MGMVFSIVFLVAAIVGIGMMFVLARKLNNQLPWEKSAGVLVSAVLVGAIAMLGSQYVETMDTIKAKESEGQSAELSPDTSQASTTSAYVSPDSLTPYERNCGSAHHFASTVVNGSRETANFENAMGCN